MENFCLIVDKPKDYTSRDVVNVLGTHDAGKMAFEIYASECLISSTLGGL